MNLEGHLKVDYRGQLRANFPLGLFFCKKNNNFVSGE